MSEKAQIIPFPIARKNPEAESVKQEILKVRCLLEYYLRTFNDNEGIEEEVDLVHDQISEKIYIRLSSEFDGRKNKVRLFRNRTNNKVYAGLYRIKENGSIILLDVSNVKFKKSKKNNGPKLSIV